MVTAATIKFPYCFNGICSGDYLEIEISEKGIVFKLPEGSPINTLSLSKEEADTVINVFDAVTGGA